MPHSQIPPASFLHRFKVVAWSLILLATPASAQTTRPDAPLSINGVYPHLAVFNKEGQTSHGECGIGAIVPWAGKLWLITYPPHMPKGSSDKLYAIDADLAQQIRPESVGGTHAGRLIHRQSNQLIIGPYFIDSAGKVRVADIKKLVGRITGIAHHLTDPANKVYIYEMEGAVYEVDVHTLAVTKLFNRAAPGAHGKGAYTGQGVFVISNNGDKGPNNVPPAVTDPAGPPDPQAAGALAEWDGKTWTVIQRRPFTDITGPGGINGAPTDASPIWAIGWDKRSVILMLRDGGIWSLFRLPKASHAYDPQHGWYTEWPRIREVAPGKLMMDMHAMFYDFPASFSLKNTAGITPIASHLRYIPDFCHWNGKLVLATDETTIMANPLASQAQSNLWFGTLDDLKTFGPSAGWGGPWLNDPVKAGVPSDPFLINGFSRRIIHLSHNSPTAVQMTLEIEAKGDGQWSTYTTIAIPPKGYSYHIFPASFSANWIRIKANQDCTATAYFHYSAAWPPARGNTRSFAGLANATEKTPRGGIIRPAAHNRNLQFLWAAGSPTYIEVNETLQFLQNEPNHTAEVAKIAAIKKDFEVDDASVIMTQAGQRYRLPKSDSAYDTATPLGWPRGIRECESERFLLNIHGTFYEMPRENGLPQIKPICTHHKQILDFCTWRGLLVLSGIGPSAKPDGNTFLAANGQTGLWFGGIDDLWAMGTPTGHGGPWAKREIKANIPSDPYLMTGYNNKRLELSHNATEPVTFTIEVDTDHTGWKSYQSFTVPPGQTVPHQFPDGFSAHWVRAAADKPCTATAWFTYD